MLVRSGFVTPKYLDQKWCKNFSVSSERRTEADIPVQIHYEEKAYLASWLNNSMKSYKELEVDFSNHTKRISELELEVASCKSLHKIDLEFISESLEKINNQSLDSPYKVDLILALISDVKNNIKKFE